MMDGLERFHACARTACIRPHAGPCRTAEKVQLPFVHIGVFTTAIMQGSCIRGIYGV